MHYVYLLQYGDVDIKYYIGCTSDLKNRVDEHRAGNGCQTTKRVADPTKWRLVYYEVYRKKRDATRREARLKDHGAARGHVYKRAKDSMNT